MPCFGRESLHKVGAFWRVLHAKRICHSPFAQCVRCKVFYVGNYVNALVLAHIQNFANASAPLIDLIKQNTPWR